MRKKLLLKILCMAGIIGTLITFPTFANEWKQDENGWWYEYTNGTCPKNGWQTIDGKWYCFDENGYMRTGWIEIDGKSYYCDVDSGEMLTNTTTPDGYYVGSDGVWDGNAAQEVETNNIQKAHEQETEAYSNLVYPIDVLGCGFGMDSVGGISPWVGFRNNSGKTIKYITFEMTPYNRVDDPVVCTIRGYSTTTCRATGPFEPDEGIGDAVYSITSGVILVFGNNTDHPYYYTSRTNEKKALPREVYGKTFTHTPGWDCVWYNSNIYKIYVTKAIIEYMDGTTDTVSSLNFPLYHEKMFD